MADFAEVVGDRPKRLGRRHPINRIETLQIHRPRIWREASFRLSSCSNAQSRKEPVHAAYDKRESESVGLNSSISQCAPIAIRAVNRDDMVVIANRREIQNERRQAVRTQSGGSEQSAFETVCSVVLDDESRRPAGFAGLFFVVRQIVQVLLDFLGRCELAQQLIHLR